MKYFTAPWFAILFALLLTACAGAPPIVASQTDSLFNDRLFSAPTDHINAADIFALSAEMKQYIESDMAVQLRDKGLQQGLYDAIYQRGQLKIEYESSMTRNAAQAFAARSGNCMSMAIMTAAFAKAVGLKVQFQSVLVNEAWSHSGNMLFSAGHINVVLLEKRNGNSFTRDIRRQYTIDFLPPGDMLHYQTEDIGENTVIAMYMNNRAAEALALGQLDNAYWWAQNAIKQDTNFLNSYNTLGVIYRSHGNLPEARQAFQFVLGHDTEETSAMFNLAETLKALGEPDAAKILTLKLEQLRSYQPYYFFNLGRQAMKDGDFKSAKEFFGKEVKREPLNPEFNYWLGSALLALGEIKPAGRFVEQAIENSTTTKEHALYETKLNRIKAANKAAESETSAK